MPNFLHQMRAGGVNYLIDELLLLFAIFCDQAHFDQLMVFNGFFNLAENRLSQSLISSLNQGLQGVSKLSEMFFLFFAKFHARSLYRK
jgi:hypothetical protein